MTKKENPDGELATTHSAGSLDGNREKPKLLIDDYHTILPIVQLIHAIDCIKDNDNNLLRKENLYKPLENIERLILANDTIKKYAEPSKPENSRRTSSNPISLSESLKDLKKIASYIKNHWDDTTFFAFKIKMSLTSNDPFNTRKNKANGKVKIIEDVFGDNAEKSPEKMDLYKSIIEKLIEDIKRNKEAYEEKLGITTTRKSKQ